MSKMTKMAEAKQQGDTITVEYFGLPPQASRAEAGTAIDLGIGVREYMAYQDEDEDEDYRQDDDDQDEDDDDLDEDDLDEDEEDEDEEDQEEGELDE